MLARAKTENYDNEDVINEEDDVINEDPTALIQESPSYEFCNYTTEAKKNYI